jgi:pimeloyl-ACP methyl ester carboxylesterase
MGLIQSELLTVGDRSFEIAVAGSGAPAVILVNGSGGHLDSWFRIFGKLAESGRVFAYNRSGIGRSSALKEPQTVSACARNLLGTIGHAGIAPPWIMVGHSFGGLIANFVARREPQSVAAVAFLDATTPADIDFAAGSASAPGLFGRVSRWLSPKMQHSEIIHSSTAGAEIEQAGPFPQIPVSVISGARSAAGWSVPKPFREARQQNQRGLATLSPLGRHIIASKSGHFPQISEPNLVVQTIVDLRAAVQGVPGS